MNNYSDSEYEIFSRLFIQKEFSEENIKKLGNINIGIAGVGGIGCPLSQYLINSGIKKMTLVDGDNVEKSNLNRQILFGFNDIGEKKVNVAKKKLQLTNPNCIINVFDKNINERNLNLLSGCSLIVDSTDNWQVSKLLNKFCLKNSITFLYSSVIKNDLQVILFENNKNNDHVCLNCIFPNKDDIDLPRCETVGISGISAGLAGLIAAQKIINFCLNLKEERNILTISDGKQLSIENILVRSKHSCNLNKFEVN